MNSERWQKIKGLFDVAQEIPSAKREKFLDKACAGDVDLRREVENLLSSFENPTSFMEQPAAKEVASLIIERNIIERNNDLESGQMLSHYQISSKIGEGGMGDVYLAQDTRLNRGVAIKLLSVKLNKNENHLRRFVQEARAASALNHPNIITVYEIGEFEDTHFIAAEYIEGETLRERLSGELTLSEVLDITTQMASALSAAHKAGIVHRDVKPENVMIRRDDDLVKVLDFGLAKLTEQQAIGDEDATLAQVKTNPGVILGTVNYMSPEQAKSEKVDGRTDIFSFGAVIYEMIAGRTPFAGDSISETFANLINAEPLPLSRFASNVPHELQRIVSKMLRKNKDERYQTMKDVLTDLKDLRENLTFEEKLERSSAPENANATAILQATTGDANIQTAVTNYSFTGQIKRHKPLAALVLFALLIGTIGFGYYFWSAKKSALGEVVKKSLAVLPFVNASQDANAEYLSDGITESVINNLSQLSGLRVMSRNSAFRFKDNQTDIKNIASQLGVETIVTGDIKQIGDKLVINVRLIDGKYDSQIWGNQYVKNFGDVIAVQNEIARDVSLKLGARLSGADERQLAKKYTENPEAYQLFLKGRYILLKGAPQNIKKSEDYFRQAIALDPNFALAYAFLSGYYTLNREPLKAKEAVIKAISLDDQLPTAHDSLGIILERFDFDYVGAEREFKRALELDPNNALALESYGLMLSNLGRHEEAMAKLRLATETDPLGFNTSYGKTLLYARRYDEAAAQYKKSLELDSDFARAHLGLSIVYQMKGNYAESVEETAKIKEKFFSPQAATFVRESFANGGWQGFLRAMTGNPQAPKVPPYILATFYAELGEKDKAIAILNKIYEDHGYLGSIKVDPRFDSMHDDPRYQDLLRRVGLPQ